MKQILQLSICGALLLCHSATLCADEPSTLDPESVDDVTLALARLSVETSADEISEEAYHSAKVAVLDALGCAMAGYRASGVPAVVEVTKEFGGREEATIWFHGGKVPGPAATFANSVQTHALDLDDFHSPSITHITSVIVPAAFAMGERNGASGKETLASIVLGIEVAGRLGRACHGLHAHQGFLPTSVMGGFGATAAACRLQGCTVDETVNAMGIWYAHCSGNRQALYDRTLTKRIQSAIAARASVFASYLADKGLPGPKRIIAGQPASLVPIYGLTVPADNAILWAGDRSDVRGLAIGSDGLVVLHEASVEGLSADGETLWNAPLPCPPVRWGVALTGEGCVVTLTNGQVVCLEEMPGNR